MIGEMLYCTVLDGPGCGSDDALLLLHDGFNMMKIDDYVERQKRQAIFNLM